MTLIYFKSICPFLLNLGSRYLVYTFIIVGTCKPGMFHLTLTSFSWSTDIDKFTSSFRDQVSFSITTQSLDSPYLVHTLIMEGGCHLTMICHGQGRHRSVSTPLYKNSFPGTTTYSIQITLVNSVKTNLQLILIILKHIVLITLYC